MQIDGAGVNNAGPSPTALNIARGLAIASVIYGHALAPWVILAGERFSEAAFLQWKLGAAFLMPFFFFASGLSWRERTSLSSALRQALALIFIAWSAGSLIAVSRFGLGGIGLGDPVTLLRLIKDVARMAVYGDHYLMATMWFLTAIGLVRLIAALIYRFGAWAMWAAAAALFIFSLAVAANGWRNYYQIAVLGGGMVAFAAGYAARAWFQRAEHAPRAATLACVASGAILFATFAFNQGCAFDVSARCPLPIIPGEFSVTMSYGAYGNLPLYFLTAAAGVCFMATLALLIARFGRGLRWPLAAMGRNTIALLIVNGFYLEWVHPLVQQRLAPNIEAQSPAFFVLLLAAALALNLAAAALLARPIRAWIALAAKFGGHVVSLPLRLALLQRRGARVSEGA